MADHLHLGLPFRCRLLLFLCLVHPWRAHLGHQSRSSFRRCSRLRSRLAHLQGEKHKEQVARPALRDHRHDSPLDWLNAIDLTFKYNKGPMNKGPLFVYSAGNDMP